MKEKYKTLFILSSVLLIIMLALYFIAFCCLNTDLKSIFDEGYFYLNFKSRESFSAFTQPLSLGKEVLSAFVPNIDTWDILSLRRLAFFIKLLGLIVMTICSVFFVRKHMGPISPAFIIVLVSCILLFGLYIIPSVVISSNDELVFCEMIAIALCFCSIIVKQGWIKDICLLLVGIVSFLAMLCNAPGGGMLLFLCVLFLSFYSGFNWRHFIRIVCLTLIGILLGIVIMHIFVISIPECRDFFLTALSQTTDNSTASHHSLYKLFISILLNIKALIIIVVSLFGITYVSQLIGRYTGKEWLSLIVGLGLFFVYYKWQVKPGVDFACIMTWLFLMTWVSYGRHDRSLSGENVLALFLFLLPFCLSIGSNSGFIYKSRTVIVPWGLLLFLMINWVIKRKPGYSTLLYLFVFALVMIGPGRYLINCLSWESDHFDQEKPIARMNLSKAQYDFYTEVYNILGDYGYVSQKDTLLGFCFNEMTIVAMDAIPYSNDQQPEEFLQHNTNALPRPSFIILSEWDETVLSPFFSSIGWQFPDDYDFYKLESNPDPDANYDSSQSTLYCLKNRRIGYD